MNASLGVCQNEALRFLIFEAVFFFVFSSEQGRAPL